MCAAEFRRLVRCLVVLCASLLRALPIAAADEGPKPAELLTIPAATLVEFRLDEKVKARKSRAGEKVPATVASPVVVEGVRVIAAGTAVTVVVTDARRKKAGYFRTAEGYVALEAVGVSAVDGTQVPLESVTPIEAGNKDKKFTWTAHNANLKADDVFVARVTRDTAIKRP